MYLFSLHFVQYDCLFYLHVFYVFCAPDVCIFVVNLCKLLYGSAHLAGSFLLSLPLTVPGSLAGSFPEYYTTFSYRNLE